MANEEQREIPINWLTNIHDTMTINESHRIISYRDFEKMRPTMHDNSSDRKCKHNGIFVIESTEKLVTWSMAESSSSSLSSSYNHHHHHQHNQQHEVCESRAKKSKDLEQKKCKCIDQRKRCCRRYVKDDDDDDDDDGMTRMEKPSQTRHNYDSNNSNYSNSSKNDDDDDDADDYYYDYPTKVCLISLNNSHNKQLQSILLISTLLIILLFSSSIYSNNSSSSSSASNYHYQVAAIAVSQPVKQNILPIRASLSSRTLTATHSQQRQQQDEKEEEEEEVDDDPDGRSISDNNSEQQQQQQQKQLAKNDDDKFIHKTAHISGHKSQQSEPATTRTLSSSSSSSSSSADQVNGISVTIETLVSGLVPNVATRRRRRRSKSNNDSIATAAAAAAAPTTATINADTRRSKRSPHPPIITGTATTETDSSSLEQKSETRRPYVDCRRLAGFWDFLTNSYPALGDYLFSLALNQLEATARNDGHNKWSSNNLELSQTVKLIGQLLSEANQLARDKSIVREINHPDQLKQQQQQQQNTVESSQPHSGNLHLSSGLGGKTAGSATWLTRVVANPAYARIIQQHLLRRQQQLRQHQNVNRLPPLHHKFSAMQRDDDRLDESKSSSPNSFIGSTIVGPDSDSSSGSYGRVIHYPREYEQNRADSTSKTIDKLHTLNSHHHNLHHSTDQSLADQTNEIGRLAESSSGSAQDSIVENNQIPSNIQTDQSADDVDSKLTSAGQRILPSSSSSPSEDQAKVHKPKYVYGDVLLRPSQAKEGGNFGSVDNGAQPIDKLRMYNRLNQNNNPKQQQHHQHPYLQQQQQHRGSDKSMDAYGRIIVSPQHTSIGLDNNRDQKLSTTMEQQSQTLAAGKYDSSSSSSSSSLSRSASSLNKLRDQLEPSQFGFANPPNDQQQQQQQHSSAPQVDSDELAAQQQTSSISAIDSHNSGGDGTGGSGEGAGGAAASSNPRSEDEFEGFWHSGPVENVELSRQVRRESSSSHHQNGPDNRDDLAEDPMSKIKLRLTTSSPGEVLAIN